MAYQYRGTQHDVVPEARNASTPGPKPKGFNPDHCGTYRGYKQHYRHGTEVCDPCREARREYQRSRQVPRVLKPCGTHAAYRRHKVEGTEVCGPCNEANNAYHREQYRARTAGNVVVVTPIDASACGTYRGYRRHVRRGGAACQPCTAANAAYQTEYREARKAAA
jgi:hypothetical protein